MNLAENLERSAFYFRDRPAVIEEGRQVSYFEFNQESNRIATALMELGVQPDDTVGLCAPNSYEWLAFYFGVLKAGAIAVTLPMTFTKAELKRLLDDAQPRFFSRSMRSWRTWVTGRTGRTWKRLSVLQEMSLSIDCWERDLIPSRRLMWIGTTPPLFFTQEVRQGSQRASC
jgi:acyl-CoA synthetase (AMP-forming)/AMP-acid ligase II